MWTLRVTLLKRWLTLSATAEGRRNALILGLFLLFVVLTSRLSVQLFDTLRLTPEIGTSLVFRVIAMSHLSFFIMLVFSSIVSAALILFENPENELLFALPISSFKLFLTRSIESMLATGWMVFLFGTPLAVGLGRSFVAGWDYALVAIFSLLGLIVLPTTLGAFFLILTFAFLPKHRLKVFAVILTLLGSYFAVDFAARIDIGVLFRMEFESGAQLESILKTIEIPNHPYTPDTLSAQAMAEMVKGDTAAALRRLGFLWAENIIGLAILLGLSYPLYLRGWARHHQSSATVSTAFPFSMPAVRRSPFLSLCFKDLKILSRDIIEWSQMLVLLTLIFVHIVNIRDLPLDEAYLKNFVSFVNLGISGLLLVAVSVRFVYPTFVLEGESVYLLKTLPVDPVVPIRAKFWTPAAILLLLSQALLFVANRQTGVSLFFSVFSHAVCAVQALSIVGLALLTAVVVPPRGRSSLERAAGSAGALLFMILGSLYVTATLTFFTAPIYKNLLAVAFSQFYLKQIAILFCIYLSCHLFMGTILKWLLVRQYQRI